MKPFLAVFMGSENPEAMARWKALDEKTRKDREKAGMEAWAEWGRKNQAAILSNGAPLGKTKQVDAKGLSDIKNRMAAYTLVQAESHEAAAKLFDSHPHFTIFPGESVEIMECLPLPKEAP